jgi:CRISPR-associated protein Cas2
VIILVTYDIVKNKNRVKLRKLLLDYGYPVQKSVFELMLDWDKLERLKREIQQYVKDPEDSVRFYQVCDTCRRNVRVLGLGERFLNDEYEVY